MPTNIKTSTIKDTYDRIVLVDDDGVDIGSGTATKNIEIQSAAGVSAITPLHLSTTLMGIGTATPATALHLHQDSDCGLNITSAAGNDAIIYLGDGDSGSSIVAGKYGYLMWDGGNQYLALGTGSGGLSLAVKENGHVGIGHNNPTYTLDVETADEIIASFVSTDDRGVIQISDNDTNGYIMVSNNNMQFGGQADHHSASLVVKTNGGGVGIGTTSPAVASSSAGFLDIENSTASATNQGGALRVSSNDGALMGSGHRLGVVEFAGAEDGSSTMSIGASIQAFADQAWGGSTNDTDLQFFTTLGTSHTPKMTIQDDGNVGIGTTGPSNLLDIAGNDPFIEINDTTTGVSNGDSQGGIAWVTSDTDNAGTAAKIFGKAYGTSGAYAIHMEAGANGSLNNLQLVLQQDGMVGVGTENPNRTGLTTNKSKVLTIENTTTDSDSTGATLELSTLENTNASGMSLGSIIVHVEENDAAHERVAQIAFQSDGSTSNQRGGRIDFDTKGDGTGSAPATRMCIRESGNVGIGTTSPEAELEIAKAGTAQLIMSSYSDDAAHYPLLWMRKADDTEGDPNLVSDDDPLGVIAFGGSDNDADDVYLNGAEIIARVNGSPTDGQMPCDLEFWTNTGTGSPDLRMKITEGGLVNIDGLTASQDVQTDGSKNLVSSSDMNWKTDLGLVENGIDIVNSLKPRYFKWKRDASGKDISSVDQPRLAGFFAQEVFEKFPEGSPGGANKDENDVEHWGLNSRAIIAVMTKAIQELSVKVTALEGEDSSSDTKIAALETENTANKTKITALETKDAEYATTITALTNRITALESA